MIKSIPFWEILKPFDQYFKGLKDGERDVYYDHLKNSYEPDLKRAVDILIDTHETKYWPTVNDIRQTLAEIARSASYATADELDRRLCPNGCTKDGFLLLTSPEGYTTAVSCDCEKGQRRASCLKAYFKRQGKSYIVNPSHEERKPYREPGDDSETPF